MGSEDLDSRLRELFASVFGVAASSVGPAATPETVDGWDSVNHINLVLSVEAEFGVAFEADEIADLSSFGALRERIAGKLGA